VRGAIGVAGGRRTRQAAANLKWTRLGAKTSGNRRFLIAGLFDSGMLSCMHHIRIPRLCLETCAGIVLIVCQSFRLPVSGTESSGPRPTPPKFCATSLIPAESPSWISWVDRLQGHRNFVGEDLSTKSLWRRHHIPPPSGNPCREVLGPFFLYFARKLTAKKIEPGSPTLSLGEAFSRRVDLGMD